MATMPKLQPTTTVSHEYDADARLLSGQLLRPVKRAIDAQAQVTLTGERDRHLLHRADAYSLDGLVSYSSGYTRVSGNHDDKEGWVTLATAVVEDLNILDVVTADRVVAQVSTEHPPLDGHVPSVTFLGTQFENLRIAGHPVTVDLDLAICSSKPPNDRFYSEDPEFLDRVEGQFRKFKTPENALDLPRDLRVQYDDDLKQVAEMRRFRGPYGKGYKSTLKCSLVKNITGSPFAPFGNALYIPDFGTITLAAIEIEQSWTDKVHGVATYFDLTMLKVTMGSLAAGQVQITNVGANGKTRP
jgi:hypothetical protein